MNIYDEYPASVELEGSKYLLNLSYDRVLRVMDVQEMDDLTAADKLQVQCAWLLAESEPLPSDPETCARIISAVFALFPKSEERVQERYIDFHQDAALIRSGFMRAYGMDLTREKPHFLQFMELLADLPEDTALMRTIDIRRRPIPKPTKDNAELIAQLQQAKARVAIKVTEEERRSRFADSLKASTALKG